MKINPGARRATPSCRTWRSACAARAHQQTRATQKYATNYPTVKFYTVDIDINREAAGDEEITAMPTFKYFKRGAEARGHVCVQSLTRRRWT